MTNLPANRGQTTLANKPANLPAVGPGGVFSQRPANMQEAMQLAKLIADSSFCPRSFKDKNGVGRSGDILIVLFVAEELDVTVLQALSGVMCFNGVPKIWGDLGPALILRSGLCEYFLDDWDEASQTCVVRIKRKGKPAREFTYSWAEAVKAQLDQKETYRLFRRDMCTWRAKTRAMRTEFPDILKGLAFAEDAMGVDGLDGTVEPPPIQMPREIGAPTPTPEPAGVGSGSQFPRDESPAPHYEEQLQEEVSVQIFVVSAEEKPYTNKKTGKPGKYYVIELSDAMIANTFSETFFNLAHDAGANQKPVKYTVVAGRKYQDAEGVERQGWNLDTLELAPVAKAEAPAEGGA